jgi:hypothetical protein
MQPGIMSVVWFDLEPAHPQTRPQLRKQLQRCDLRKSLERAVEQSNPAGLLLGRTLPDGGFSLRGRYVAQPETKSRKVSSRVVTTGCDDHVR